MFSKCSTSIRGVFTKFVKSYTNTTCTKMTPYMHCSSKDLAVCQKPVYTREFMWWVLWHILEDLQKDKPIKKLDFSPDSTFVETRHDVTLEESEQSFEDEDLA